MGFLSFCGVYLFRVFDRFCSLILVGFVIGVVFVVLFIFALLVLCWCSWLL